ncbi:sigma-54 interaction domain-containing protein [Clostridium minihomine]|uniref:sigma-54 interaction domain-containing protein n=1 Tax=Clostridium minihomine TaxID=2045012 RepID=UPI000C76FA54|nr:sigma 54-interacting transcriptional regulator [Clostridium minihomine]
MKSKFISGSDITLDERIYAMLNTPFEGVLAIDTDCRIFFVNQFFQDFFQMTEQEMLGKDIRVFLPKCLLPETLGRGYSEWGDTLVAKGKESLVARFPIKKDGIVIGALVKTIFPDMVVGKSIAEKLGSPVKVSPSTTPIHLYTCMDLVGETESMLYVKKLARRASRTNSTVLISGESGTGKEVVAQAIHTRSVRRDAPFISVNCGAIPTNLIEAELFGYVSGAFTGALRGGNPGKFELANGGTILLDEIGDMPLDVQVKLLRVLQEREVWRIGARAPVTLDVRVIASTNRDLREMIRQGTFREDLYYRINILAINIPPLRERKADLQDLVRFLLRRINARIGSHAERVTPEAMAEFMGYDWPGNVRELENILEQAVNWSEGELVSLEKVPNKPWEGCPSIPPEDTIEQPYYHDAMTEKEKQLILDALARNNGNRVHTALDLGISRSVLYRKMDKYKIK